MIKELTELNNIEEEFEKPPVLNLTSILRDQEQSLDLSQVQFYNDDAVDKLDLSRDLSRQEKSLCIEISSPEVKPKETPQFTNHKNKNICDDFKITN